MCSCGTSELTLEQTGEKCWIQRASFTHADLHDELVSDLVALLEHICDAATNFKHTPRYLRRWLYERDAQQQRATSAVLQRRLCPGPSPRQACMG